MKDTATEGRDLGVVRYERDGAIARIVLNWPERANAQSSEMVDQVDSCLDGARQDYGVKVVIVEGAGKGFCAGHVMAPDAYPEFAESRAATTRAARSCSCGPPCGTGSSRSR